VNHKKFFQNWRTPMTLKIRVDAATLKEIALDYGVEVDIDVDDAVKELLANELSDGFAKEHRGKLRLSQR
jgi:hypothetical protein